MNKYIIINGMDIAYIEKDTLREAVVYCQNYCDHSKEVIVREYKQIKELIND